MDRETEIEIEDDENQPIEVVLDGEDSGDEEKPKGGTGDEVPGAVVAPGRKRPRYKETVVRLKGENRQLSDAAQRLYDENQRLKSDMGNLSQSGMVNYERGLNAEQKLAQRQLEDAIKSEDATAQAAAQSEVSRIAAELNDVKAWKAQNPAPDPNKKPEPLPQQQQRPTTLAEPVKQWIDQNPWFDERTDEYDEDMHFEAVEYARVLEARLQRQGKAAEINTPSYFAKIREHMAKEFPEQLGNEDEEPETPPERKPQSKVAPVSRAAPASGETKGKTKVQLTADDVAQVRKMVAEKAVKHPWDHPDVTKRGRDKTFDEAIHDFALRKRASEQNPSERQPQGRR